MIAFLRKIVSGKVAGPIAALIAAGIFATPAAPAGAQEAATAPAPAVTVPLFWDPRDRPPQPDGEATPIRFLTAGDFPPFDFLDRDGRLTGYHVDLARRICRDLKVECTIQMRPFADLVTALDEKRGDAVIAGLAVDAALREKLDTTDAYLTTPGRFVTRRDATLAMTPEALAGHWVSVVSGSAHERFLLDRFPLVRLAAFPDETSARDALRDGKVEAHFGDAISLSFWLSGSASHGCCDFRDGPWLESAYFGEGLRIAVARTNPRLEAQLDLALRHLAADGSLAELYLRWFPRGYY